MGDITEKKVWSTKQIIALLAVVITVTFYATVIYLQIQSIESRLDKKIQIINQNTHEINKLKGKV